MDVVSCIISRTPCILLRNVTMHICTMPSKNAYELITEKKQVSTKCKQEVFAWIFIKITLVTTFLKHCTLKVAGIYAMVKHFRD